MKHIKKILPIIGIALFFYLIYTTGLQRIAATFMKISPLHIVAVILLSIPVVLINNFQWQLILKKHKIKISYIESLKISIVSVFYGAVTPGKIGTYVKIYYLKEKTKQPYGKLFTNALIFSVITYITLFCFLIIGSLFFISKIPVMLPIVIICFTIFIALIVILYKKERGEKIFKLLLKLTISKKLKKLFSKFLKTFYDDFPKLKGLILPLLIDFPAIALSYTQIYIIALSLGIRIPYYEFIFICPIITIATLIPFSPGALGIREASVMGMLSFYGVAPEVAFVLSLASFLTIRIPKTILGSLIALKWGLKDKQSNLISRITSIKKQINLSFR